MACYNMNVINIGLKDRENKGHTKKRRHKVISNIPVRMINIKVINSPIKRKSLLDSSK